MSRKRTKPEDIRNSDHYFNRYVAKEAVHIRGEQQIYNSFFSSLDEMLESGAEGPGSSALMSVATNINNCNLEDASAALTEFGWIEQIENVALYEAISIMPVSHKRILTLRFQHNLSQPETAKLLGVAQQTVSRYEKRIIRKIKKFLKTGCVKP